MVNDLEPQTFESAARKESRPAHRKDPPPQPQVHCILTRAAGADRNQLKLAPRKQVSPALQQGVLRDGRAPDRASDT